MIVREMKPSAVEACKCPLREKSVEEDVAVLVLPCSLGGKYQLLKTKN